MKLFGKRGTTTKVKQTVVVPPKFAEIPITAEQKAMLRNSTQLRGEQIVGPVSNNLKNVPLKSDANGSDSNPPISLLNGL